MLTRKKLQTTLILVIGIIVLVNIISEKYFFRLDLTEDKRYSLSDATINILKDLTEPITVTAYFSENLPPNVEKTRQDFKDLLIEYVNESDGMLVYEFIDPSTDQQKEMDAQQSGVSPIMINVREKDEAKQQKAYLGAVLQMGDQKDAIPFIRPGAAMEYALSSSIKKLSVKDKPRVGLLQGNGEPTIKAMQQLDEQLGILYNVEPLTLTDTTGIPSDINTLAIVAPADSMNDRDLSYLDQFINRGGNLMVALNRVEGKLQEGKGEVINTGLDKWLAKKGITVEDDFVTDVNSGSVYVRQQQGMFVMNTPVQFHYLPVITTFADHPITRGLESVGLRFASSIKTAFPDSAVKVTNILETSEKSGIEKAPVYFNIMKEWTKADFNRSHIPVGVAVEGPINGKSDSKMVVFGDGDFATNGEGQQAQRLESDNVSLMANAIDWLSDDTGLIELRTKGVTDRPLTAQLEDGTKTFIKLLNFILPVLLIIIYGMIRYQIRRNKRNKLMATDYGK